MNLSVLIKLYLRQENDINKGKFNIRGEAKMKSIILSVCLLLFFLVNGYSIEDKKYLNDFMLNMSIDELEGNLKQYLTKYKRPDNYSSLIYYYDNNSNNKTRGLFYEDDDFLMVGNTLRLKKVFGYKLGTNKFLDGEFCINKETRKKKFKNLNNGKEFDPHILFFYIDFPVDKINKYVTNIEFSFYNDSLYKIVYYINFNNFTDEYEPLELKKKLISNYFNVFTQNKPELNYIKNSYKFTNTKGSVKANVETVNEYEMKVEITDTYKEYLSKKYLKDVKDRVEVLVEKNYYKMVNEL